MALKPYQEKIIQQMIDQERLLSELYALFAKEFPQYSEFWTELSEEEKRHARLIAKLEEAEKKRSGICLMKERSNPMPSTYSSPILKNNIRRR